MKPEKVEWMRVYLCEESVFPAAIHEALAQLFDERAALLAFAKRMDRTLDAHLYQAERAECAAALAKAEGP